MTPSQDQATTPRLLGIWIDHRVARYVELVGDEAKLSEIESNVERKHRATGGTQMPRRNWMKSFTASTRNVSRTRNEHLRRFYAKILESLRDFDRVVLLGPGEAKVELATKLRRSKELAPKLADVLTEDGMTDPQLVALVRRYYH